MSDSVITHHTTFVNEVRLHYVTAGQVIRSCCSTAGQRRGINGGRLFLRWLNITPLLLPICAVSGILRNLQLVTTNARVADDIYQLVQKLGFQRSFWSVMIGADRSRMRMPAAHPDDVRRLVILDVPIPGAGLEKIPQASPRGGLWHMSFHGVRDLPEILVAGKEREYLTWFYRTAYNPTAIEEKDIDEYVRCYAAPGGMRAGFEYYRALWTDVEHNTENAKTKLKMPVLALGGKYSFGKRTLTTMQTLAENVEVARSTNAGIGFRRNNQSI